MGFFKHFSIKMERLKAYGKWGIQTFYRYLMPSGVIGEQNKCIRY